jgi:Asp-tRNA(Asn)/Glu-tRNA(Gln) amidotransferase A subunit family amidase
MSRQFNRRVFLSRSATVAEAIALLRHHELTAVELVDAHLDRIAMFDGVHGVQHRHR